MKAEIMNEKQNPYMERTELDVEIHHETLPTPTKASIQKAIATKLGKPSENVDVRDIFSKRGIGQSTAKVYVWKDAKVKDLEKEAQEAKEASEKAAEKKE